MAAEQDGGEGVCELEDARGADKGDQGRDVGDRAADDPGERPVDDYGRRPDYAALRGDELGGVEVRAEDVLVEDFDTDVSICGGRA